MNTKTMTPAKHRRRRKAALYVRQSSAEQVERNTGSRDYQLNLISILYELGYTDDDIDLIADDLGLSGSAAEHRPGYQRLLRNIQEGEIELDVGGNERRLLGLVHGADGAADALRPLKHRGGVEQRLALAGLVVLDAFLQKAEHGLAERKIAGGGDRHDALARHREGVQLAEDRDVVEPGIGARVRDHDQAFAHEDSAAIRHGALSDSAMPVIATFA